MADIVLQRIEGSGKKLEATMILRKAANMRVAETSEIFEKIELGEQCRITGILPENVEDLLKQLAEVGVIAFEDTSIKTTTMYRPIISTKAITEIDREETLKVLYEAKKIAEESEKYEKEIIDLKNRIYQEKNKADELRKAVSAKAKLIIWSVTILAAFVGLLAGPIGAIVAAIVSMVIMNKTVKKSDLKKHEVENNTRADTHLREIVEPLESQIKEVKNHRDNLIDGGKRDWAIDVVGKDMFYSACINDLYELVKSRRADNLKEALNKYDDTLYKQRMEEMQQSIQNATEVTAAEQVKQTAQMEKIEKHTRQTARAAKITAANTSGIYANTRKKRK